MPGTDAYLQIVLCPLLNLTPTQLLWEIPNPLVNQWEHVWLVREGIQVRRAVKSKSLKAKIKDLMDRVMTSKGKELGMTKPK